MTGGFGAGNFNQFVTGNQPISVLSRWQHVGDVASIQKLTASLFSPLLFNGLNANSSDAAWRDASFVRLKNLSLSWHLPDHWARNVHLQNCQLYAQSQNLLTFTKYRGLDPETQSSYTLPPLRTIIVGVKMGL